MKYSASLVLNILVFLFAAACVVAGMGYINLWSIHHLAAVPTWLFISVSVLTVLMLVAQHVVAFGSVMKSTLESLSQTDNKRVALVGIPLVIVFILLKSENHLIGDGWTVLSNLKTFEVFPYTEVVAFFSTRMVYLATGEAELSFLILSIPAGLVFLRVAYAFAKHISDERPMVIATFLMIAGIGQIQFFFGYVENYTWMTTLIAVFMYAGFRYATDSRLFWLAIASFALAASFHVSAIALFPGLLMILYLRYSKSPRTGYIIAFLSVVTSVIVIAGFLFVKYNGFDILQAKQEGGVIPYPILSHLRLIELANLMLLVIPLPAIVLLACAPYFRKSVLRSGPAGMFLILCSLSALFFALAIDPKLGAVRDWDLLGLFAIPVTFLAAFAVSRIPHKCINAIGLLTAAVCTILIHTIPWVVSNTYVIESKNLLKKAITNSPHYSPGYFHKGSNLVRWSYVMWSDPYYDFEEASRVCELHLAAYPDDNTNRITCSYSHYLCERFGRSQEVLSSLDYGLLLPTSAILAINLYLRYGQLDEARTIGKYGVQRFPENGYLKWHNSVIDASLESPDAAFRICMSRLRQQTDNADSFIDFGTYAHALGNADLASGLLKDAQELTGNTGRIEAEITSLRQLVRETQKRSN